MLKIRKPKPGDPRTGNLRKRRLIWFSKCTAECITPVLTSCCFRLSKVSLSYDKLYTYPPKQKTNNNKHTLPRKQNKLVPMKLTFFSRYAETAFKLQKGRCFLSLWEGDSASHTLVTLLIQQLHTSKKDLARHKPFGDDS